MVSIHLCGWPTVILHAAKTSRARGLHKSISTKMVGKRFIFKSNYWLDEQKHTQAFWKYTIYIWNRIKLGFWRLLRIDLLKQQHATRSLFPFTIKFLKSNPERTVQLQREFQFDEWNIFDSIMKNSFQLHIFFCFSR